jgi:predicted GNAT family acetyltransferase
MLAGAGGMFGGMTTSQADVVVHRNDPHHRYEAHLDGRLAGYLDYRERDDEIVLVHTETLEGFQGRGVASALARFALDDVRSRGRRAVLLCPFLQSWLTRNPQYRDIMADGR